jgi:hypothetical protein
VEKYSRVGQATDENMTRRVHCACWLIKATDTHSEYVKLIAFPLQEWLHERASMHCLSCAKTSSVADILRDEKLVSTR